ncbi:uncharacterized protein [Spinacia oleracea]|uniref:Uncharacterized protein n=1 Tax=Spinacia oleracea TaxID=3562 RepID=A0ABM3RRF5_SPIOL|nr:uncharacterized protein LOC130471873 [Spinacia oleracea]
MAKGKGESGSSRVKSLNPISSTVGDPAMFIELAGLPPSAEVKIPGEDEEALDCPEGYVVMYEYPFTIGFKFPFTPLARSFIEECCRYTLVTKKGKKNLGVGLAVNDRGWQSRFVYVNKDSLGEKGHFLVEGWTTKVVKASSLAELNVDSHDKYQKFLGYSIEDRSFSRDGGRLDGQEETQTGDVEDEEEEEGEETDRLVRRRKRLDLTKEVVANSSSAEGEDDMADTSEHTLSSKPVARMSQSEMMERARKRLRSTAAGGQSSSAVSGSRAMPIVPRHSKIGASPETPVVIGVEGFHPIASSSPPKPFKELSTAVDVGKVPAASAKKCPAEKSSVEDTIISLPPRFLGDGEAAVVWPYADRLILPSTYHRYNEVEPLSVASDAGELSLRVSLFYLYSSCVNLYRFNFRRLVVFCRRPKLLWPCVGNVRCCATSCLALANWWRRRRRLPVFGRLSGR